MLILASASPRRKEILKLVGLKFQVIPSDFTEENLKYTGEKIYLPEKLAQAKAQNVSKKHPDDIVLAADTIVIIDNEILGKPKNSLEAQEMLSKLAGEKHLVSTGVCLQKGTKIRSFTSITEVEFYPMSAKEIADYVATKEPLDKAGAYAIQGLGAKYIKAINGDFYTVMGLPIAKIIQELKHL
ncbi:MAG: Maf family protein [Bacilli bacterium]|jgi:septum formation protein